ncbi:ThuA domain-containing protein [Aquibacillus salsiterrae]|uniref:ThuA domain-containing protein n=1 Tax=Aquibacillus salsiterrae TaxID=2950439 RepID=A0A9X4AEV1_9BACI|nr:ThuA domain-containing protein [Aquibacillus salsiterrae]MDC3416994.1 ThuA domain-containing protein [Aquibacillus salsiterrae]
MVKIVALLGDYWHPEAEARVGLEAAIDRLANKEEVNLAFITYEEVGRALEANPDLFINGKMDEINPRDEQVITWLTDELDKQLVNYVEAGGSVIAWHAGMASYQKDSSYIKMLRGSFDYHPPGLQEVTYMLKKDEKSGPNTFVLSDEQYFVDCDQANTEVDLWSTGVDGDSIAGWKHSYGEGKVCCFTPAHTQAGMLNENISTLLAERINWALAK